MKDKLLIIIAGPTAIGKTDLAIRLAKHLNTEIINADSRQIYREMRIGTAVPSSEQQSEAKHYFINHRSIQDHYNASQFETEVVELLDQLYRKRNVMIMTGGSGMYLDAVCKGIDDIPTVSPLVRKKIQNEFRSQGLGPISSRLQLIDPDYYKKVDLNNPQRIMKALEIAEMTGKPYSSFLTGKAKERRFSWLKIGLDMPRQDLHSRINARVDKMISQGLLQEAIDLYPHRHLNALNTVGYKELFDYIEGKYSLEESIDKIKGHTRQYARRQLTWFRKDQEMKWFHPDDYDAILVTVRRLQGII